MRVNGVPNKYEIFQDYYLETNGEEISYSEALDLFYKMDEATILKPITKTKQVMKL